MRCFSSGEDVSYCVLVILGMVFHLNHRDMRRLVNIATYGHHGGTYCSIGVDAEKVSPGSDELTDLENTAEVIAWDGTRFVWQDGDFWDCALTLDTVPPPDLSEHILRGLMTKRRTAG